MQQKLFVHLKILVGFSVLLLTIVNCVNRPCRQPQRTYQGKTTNKKVESASGQVYIYKYDGSLQCEKTAGLTIKQMKKQLGKIEVFSMEKRHDGLMHLQVCGSRTGQANVYLISIDDLASAQKKGFRVWDFK